MIVTLAGHVDHGKTSLVRAITGVDTDRLAEEKSRGLTIDLGFAYMDQGSIGFVDVPGHHKFIHNMVAGVAQHQHALMVIAADDGPMPQSREHLDILKLIGVQTGCIALTKTDLVDPDRVSQVKQAIEELTQGTFLQHAPVFTTSLDNPASIDSLLQHLRQQANGDAAQTSAKEEFRLAVDRSFVVKGIGVVVTGTVHSGQVRIDDALQIFPSQQQVRVRSIRTQDQQAEIALPGERCALNLAGLDQADIQRGYWLTSEPTPLFRELSIELDVLPHFPRHLKHWTPVHIYHATTHSTGKVALLNNQRLTPGERSVVDLVCDEPLAARYGDQILLRDYGLDVTLGGGRVIYGQEHITRRRRNPARLAQLQAYQNGDVQACLAELSTAQPVHIPTFSQARHLRQDDISSLTKGYVNQADWLLTPALWQSYKDSCIDTLKQASTQDTTSTGLKENQFSEVPAQLRSAVLAELTQEQKVQRAGSLYKLPNQAADLPAQVQKLWERAQNDLDQAQAPSTGDLAKQWRVPQNIIEAGFKELSKRGFLVHVANHRFYLPAQLQTIAQLIKERWADRGFSVKEFRDATGIGRNVAIEVLEYMDSRGFTRRRDNERILLKDQL